MSKTRRIKGNGERLVTRGELHKLLHDLATGADASLNVKMEQMREELRAEMRPFGDPLAALSAENRAHVLAKFTLQDVQGSAPTDSEGAE